MFSIKQQMLSWANRFNICCFLDNNEYGTSYNSVECIVGAGALHTFSSTDCFFPSLSSFLSLHNDWIFGHFNYDLKNEIEEKLASQNPDFVNFPDYFLFVPAIFVKLQAGTLTIGVTNQNAQLIYKEITDEVFANQPVKSLQVKPRIDREEYVKTIGEIQNHIKHGDCYEINFCQEFHATGGIDPLSVFKQLNAVSPNPFSAYYKLFDKFLLCSSPERYVKKEGNRIISQPIKGTSARDTSNKDIDLNNKNDLYKSSKDRSENVMVVDLVRNDLSRVCKEGSVVVEELFGVYSFPNVHQMISTISGELKEDVGFSDILKATFPMGSMTGAPKRKVMELIEKFEKSKRGLYSGTVGYISPEKNFDFNVVIRSLIYNQSTDYLSFHVGSAITSYSNPESEYEECVLKGKAIMKMFAGEDLSEK
ncbi:MAG: anthranilate synthase component family protein [Segetibacter sp.]|nr:anthranilate synthase component family protein [Segetibacter sp.]